MNNKIKSGIRGDQLDEMGYKEICCKDGFLKMAREVDNQIEVVILSRRNGTLRKICEIILASRN